MPIQINTRQMQLAPLTHAQVDQNFANLKAGIEAVQSTVAQVGAAIPVTSPTPPINPVENMGWIDSTNGKFYVYLKDASDDFQWVESYSADAAQSASVMEQLRASNGADKIGYGEGSVADALDGLGVPDETGRQRSVLFIAGTEQLVAPATRDAFVVGRNLTGATDCHAFADRTVMSGVTDAGTYGTFDATTELRGSNSQNHMYAFQYRNKYAGSGNIETMGGFLSVPVHSGSGTVVNHYGIEIRDVTKTGAGSITQNIGLYIMDQHAGGNNSGIVVSQSTGTSIYAPGGAKMYHKGDVGIGAQNEDGVRLTVQGGATGPRAYLHSTSTVVQMGGVGGDYPLQFVSNGAVRFEVSDSSGEYALRPGANGQLLGDVGKKWGAIYASNVALFPPPSVTPNTNGQMSFELTSDTQLKVKVKGSDGVVRSVTLTLA